MLNKLYLDLNNFKPNLGSVERGDSIELNIKLLDSEDYSRSKFRVLGTKADGKYAEQIEGINLEEKDLKVILEDQFVNCEGIVKLELNVVSGETEITTKEFYFFVSNTMNASIIDSADSLPTLEKVSKYVDDAVDNLEALKGASEDITIINSEFKENEIKRKANEMLREKNEKARVNSESIRVTGEEERETNELERIQAENDRKVSESNRKLAENTRKTNERAREEAELSRQSTFEENEEMRNENENLRIASEKERIKFNSEAKTDELNRKESEKNRVLAEEERKSSEEARVSAEAIRQNTYTDFNESEEERKSNEIKRQEAEALRVEAETRRDNLFSEKEEERNTSFIESEKVRNAAFNKAQDSRNTTFEESETIREEAFKISEKARNDAEELRVTSENERTTAERLRVDSEKARVLAEEERNNTFTQNETNRNETFEVAEEERTVAEASRVESENARVEAEKLRVAAETERVEAENLRVTAEEERVAAEIKREEGFNKFEGKINANTEELKNARSATTGEQFGTLDERIDHEVDRLNKKIEVSMLQQESAERHVVKNTVEGMTADMIVKGRTLQNHDDYCNVFPNGLVLDNYKAKTIKNKTIKSNVGYTFIFTVGEYSGSVDKGGYVYELMYVDGTHKRIYDVPAWVGEQGEKRIYFTPQKEVEEFLSWNRSGEGSISISNIMVLEGDWTNKEIPPYFEGIKSFGEAEGNKISILSHNKNFFNINQFPEKINEKGELEFKADGNSRVANYMQIYTERNLNSKNIFNGYDSVGKEFTTVNQEKYYIWIGLNGDKKDNKVWGEIILPKNTTCYYSAINEKGDNFVRFKDIQIEVGTSKTQYEPYKCDKKDILLSSYGFDEGLRGINSVTDELNSIRNMAIKRIGKSIFNGDEVWQKTGVEVGTDIETIRFQTTLKDAKDNAGNKFIVNFPTLSMGTWASDVESVQTSNGAFYIRIKKSKLETQDVDGFVKWLRSNPLTIYFELKEPIETPLNESINLKVYNEKTYVSFENSINGTSSFKAPVNTVATIDRLNRENRALEEENKNLRQDFESTTLVLTDSDLELVKQNVDMDFRLTEVEFALDIPQAILSSNIKLKNKKGEVKSMARTPYEMMKIVILSGDYDREDYIHKVGKYYERGRMTKEEHDELMSLMTADEVISK